MDDKRKKVFISYSWDNPEHQEWVLKLAKDLTEKYGVEVILDKYELKMGSDLPYFMENSIEKADKVLMILTPEYKNKAETRVKGVGYESSMISQEIFESPITNSKFLPILRKGDRTSSVPKYVKSKINHQMTDDNDYDMQLFILAKAIYDEDTIKKPELGSIPDFSSQDIDPFIAKANSIKLEAEINREIDALLYSYEGVRLAHDEILGIQKGIREKIDLYEASTGLQFTLQNNHRDRLIVQVMGYSVVVNWDGLANNSAEYLKLNIYYYTGYINANGVYHFDDERPKKNKEDNYKFDLNYKKEPVWKLKEVIKKEEIISKIFAFLIEKIQDEKAKKFRGK